MGGITNMVPAVLLIGDGPFAYCLAKKFTSYNYTIIMSTIYENSIEQIRSHGYIPIYSINLHEDGCKRIYEQTKRILEENSLELNFLIHTARSAFYEFDQSELPEEIKCEMYKVNSESPVTLAKYFNDLEYQYVFTSSCATKGFKKSLSTHAIQNSRRKQGTHGLKHYSYTKRLGEEKLYNFFKNSNKLSHLTIAYILIMFETNFFKDMGVTDPTTKGPNAKEIADYIINMLLKGKKRIYPGAQAKLMQILPSFINAILLDSAEVLKTLPKIKSETIIF